MLLLIAVMSFQLKHKLLKVNIHHFQSKIIIKLIIYIQIIVRDGGRTLQSLTSEQRSAIIEDYAKRLLDNSKEILEANKIDLDLAKKNSKIKFFMLKSKSLNKNII